MNVTGCTLCGRRYNLFDCFWQCPQCGGVLELPDLPQFDPELVDRRQRSLWRYRHVFQLPAEVKPVTFGEGGTPLIRNEIWGRTVHFKLDYLNPTGSFKDRGLSLMVTTLVAAGVDEAIEDSSGNAGASFAAYAARAGIRGRVFVPAATARAKQAQISVYGAELICVDGPRSQAAKAARRAASGGVIYASHNYNPICLAGWMTTAFELWEELGRSPDWIITPVGYGSNILSLMRGFRILKESGLIAHLPRLVGIQARACAPLWALKRLGEDGLTSVSEGETAAAGIRVIRPVRGKAVVAAVTESQGDILVVTEEEIQAGQEALARLGLYVEPTSAVVWAGVKEISRRAGKKESIVVLLTGSGLKSHFH